MNLSRKSQQFFIACIDVIILVVAIYLSLWIRNWRMPLFTFFLRHVSYFMPIIAVWIVFLYTAGFYSLEIPHTDYRAVSLLAIVALLCTLLGFAFFYLNLEARIVPKTVLVIHSLIVSVLLIFWRWIYYKIILRFAANTNIAFVGINDTVFELLKKLHNFSYMSYNALLLYTEEPCDYNAGDIRIINNPASFIGEIKKNKIQMIIIANKENLSTTTKNFLFELLQSHIHFINLTDFYEIIMRRIPIDIISGDWLLINMDLRRKKIYRLCKQTVDTVMAVILLLITMPFWPLIMLSIKIDSPGPAFFRQERVGYLGTLFMVTKFRTMRVENNTHEPTARSDSRITKVGRFLRRTRIDEIPQFLNIIKTEMSFIGPRPERPEMIQMLEQEVSFYRQRLLVKPGLSGWDQVSGEYHSPSREDTYKKLQNDLYYIKNMSLFLDASIFFKTLVTIIKMDGV